MTILDHPEVHSLFLENKYSKIYFALMIRAQGIISGEYTEKHHIWPESLGGPKKELWNIAKLTPREHYLAHLLLIKMTEGKARRSMSFALSFFNTWCKNHKRREKTVEGEVASKEFRIMSNSRWYDLSRKLLSEARRGVSPSARCRAAVSKAKKGVPLSTEQSRKISVALTKFISFFAVGPDNKEYHGPDLRKFCKDEGLSYHTLSKTKDPAPFVITAGKRKGWIISRTPVDNPEELRTLRFKEVYANRKKATNAQWTEERHTTNSNNRRMKVVLRAPDGTIYNFEALGDVKHLGKPVSTIQITKLNQTIMYGAWAGWTRLL
jgi:hypothetical protein